MIKQYYLLLIATGCSAGLIAQTAIENADGSHSLFYYSPYGSTIIYPDGSHATVIEQDSTVTTIVYSDFSFSRIFYNRSATTIIRSDFSYLVIRNERIERAVDNREPDSISTCNKEPGTTKNVTDNGYILLNDDATIKPDPGEARYILLNDLADSTGVFNGNAKRPPYIRQRANPVTGSGRTPETQATPKGQGADDKTRSHPKATKF